MCELFAMSSRIPADVTFSLHEFARHGGATGPHEDGWGIAFYEDGDAQLFREPAAAADSALVRFIEKSPPGSDLVISHIRRAVRGSRVLKNTQPFARELGGRVHLFAHNGMLDAVEDSPDLTLGEFRPVGVTDSEYAFCTLLEMLRELWSTGEPSLDERLAVVGDFAARIRPLGPANFIYCDGTAIFVHGHRRIQSDAEIRPPGLFYLCRSCEGEPDRFDTRGLRIETRAAPQEVVLVASVPLTREAWRPLDEGEILLMTGGRIVARLSAEGSIAKPVERET